MAANTFYRYDTWVKSATGPAVAGAQIYVCTQPANTASVPPSPLAAIYSDSGGLVPITQPIITDGFGHADFYALPGLYTVIVALSGVIQSIYPDQSVGGVGTSGGGGGGTGGSLSLQTNGVANSNQLIENLIAGTGITLTSDGSGGTTITNSSPASTFNVTGLGWFTGPGLNGTAMGSSFNSQITNFPANTVVVEQFILTSSWTLSACAYQLSGVGSAGNKFNFGIYNSVGSKLIDCQFDAHISTLQSVVISPAVTLPPGVYYFAAASTEALATGPHVQWSAATIQQNLNAINAKGKLIATAANSASAGVLPSTLGALTAITSVANYQGTATPVWSV